MEQQVTIRNMGASVRRVVDGLLRGGGRGKFLCSRCLVTLTKDHLDKRYATREIVLMMEDIFSAPGPILHVPVSTCVACTRENMPCLGVPAR
jgi:hypothetical protein